MTREQKSFLLDYKNLSHKLGKIPSSRDVRKFLSSCDKVDRLFGSFNQLKEAALIEYPHIAELEVKAIVSPEDLLDRRMAGEKKQRNKKNAATESIVDLLDYVEKHSASVFSGKIKPPKTTKKINDIDRALILTLSDTHFGADIKAEETGYLNYGRLEESRRLAQIVRQTIDYKTQYRNKTVLHINLLGDIIQHKLHDAQDAAPVSEQCCRAIHLITQAVALLAHHFPQVVVHCTSGNHGRDLNRHPGRATSGKWDSVETVIYYAVKNALSQFKNVMVDIPKTPYVIYEVLGHKMFATHGDNVINPGNPGKKLDISNIEKQVNRINASLKDSDEVEVVFVGHTHCASVSQLSSGSTVITNGCLTPVDPFAVSLGILENSASQTLIETVKDHAVGDIRFIKVGSSEDTDSELDKVIVPWEML